VRRLLVLLAFLSLTIVAWPGATAVQAQGNRQVLDIDGAFDLRLASNGDIALLIAQSATGGLNVLRSVSGGPFGQTEFVVSPEVVERRIFGVWATSRGFFVFQHASRRLLPRLSRSIDGVRWETIRSRAFEEPADIADIVQLTSGDLVAVGATRSAPSVFRAAMWRSHDGISWEHMPLAGEPATASSLQSIAMLGATIIVAGRWSDTNVWWRSDDDGASWVAIGSGVRGYPYVAAVNGRYLRFVISEPVENLDLTFATSSDGRSWRDGTAPGLLDEGLYFNPRQIAATASGAFIMGGADLSVGRRLDRCYTAPATCTRGAGPVVLHTTTGENWRAINIDSLLGPGFQAVAVIDTKAGTIVAGSVRTVVDGKVLGGRVEIVTVPRGSWSFLTPQNRPASQLPPVASIGASLEMGRLYRYPFHVHCGLEWLGEFNGRTWKLQRQLIGANPHAVQSLPQVQETLLGTVRLANPRTIEYAIEGVGVVAVYAPTSESPPLCI